MSWAFWRDSKAEDRAPSASDAVTETGRDDRAAELRVRTRRRLIGAAALLLAAVIVLPMLLDPSPRPVPDSVAIDIPSDKTPFTPRLSLPATPDAAAARPGTTSETAAAKAPAVQTKDKAADEPAKEAKAAISANEPAPVRAAASASDAQIILQAAALASETAARDLVVKLKKAGFAPYTETVSTQNGPRIRVRVGPFATRDDAEQARVKLKALGINAGMVSG